MSKTCDCGKKKKNFVHTCPESHEITEIFGCPWCDDNCHFCHEDLIPKTKTNKNRSLTNLSTKAIKLKKELIKVMDLIYELDEQTGDKTLLKLNDSKLMRE
jgi:hypothetical protein